MGNDITAHVIVSTGYARATPSASEIPFAMNVPDVTKCFGYAASLVFGLDAPKANVACVNPDGSFAGSALVLKDGPDGSPSIIDTTQWTRSIMPPVTRAAP